jgi:hypothetical protein
LESLDGGDGEEDKEEMEQESRWRCVSRRRSLSHISEKRVLFERKGSRTEGGRNNNRLHQSERERDGREKFRLTCDPRSLERSVGQRSEVIHLVELL